MFTMTAVGMAWLTWMALQSQAPAVPALGNDPEYTLKVQVAQGGTSAHGFSARTSFGHGNLLGPPVEGFDYTEDCNQQFASRPEGNQYFRARWKKPGQRLEILIQEFGSGRILRCELKVAMRDEAYELNPTGPVRLFPLGSSARPAVPVTEPDLNFPLRLQLAVRSAGFGSQAGSHAEGYGNVIGPPAQGFDWGNECPVRFVMGQVNTDVYQARWVEQDLQLEILLQEIGTRQKHTCLMDVGMKAAPYAMQVPGARRVRPPAAELPRSPQAPTSNSTLPPP